MTKLGEEHFFKSLNVDRFCKLPLAVANNFFYINEGRNSVAKIQDKKLVHSWTLPHPHSFMCPVVYAQSSGSLYCIRNENILLRWSAEDENLKQASRFKFSEEIFSLISVPEKEPIVLFSSGKYFECSNLFKTEFSLEPSELISLAQEENIIWADALRINAVIGILLLTLNKANNYKLHCLYLKDGVVTLDFQEPLESENHNVKSWCLNRKTCCFLTLWSNSMVLSLKIMSKEQKTLLQVSDISNCLVSIDCVGANHLAVFKSNSSNKNSSLEIYDLQFPVLKAEKEFINARSNFIQLCALDSTIFLLRDKELSQISFCSQKSTLASALGSSTSTTQTKEFVWNKGEVIQEEKVECKTSQETCTDDKMISSTHAVALKLMEKGSSCIDHLPEEELAQLLQFAVRLKMVPSLEADDVDPDLVLDALFSASFDDVSLVKFLKNMNLEEAMVTLDALLNAFSGKSFGKPKDLQLFSWICVIIQSHMPAMLLSKDKKQAQLLKEIDERLSQKVAEFQDYETIQNLLWMMQKDKILPEGSIKTKYCTETLEL